jgi:hypothetical protein
MPYAVKLNRRSPEGLPLEWRTSDGSFSVGFADLAPDEWVADEVPTTSEEFDALYGRALEAKKAKKIEEFAPKPQQDLAPLFTGGHGPIETLFYLSAKLKEVCDAMTRLGEPIALGSPLEEIVAVGNKAYTKKGAILAAQTLEELDSIVWEDGA